ncbi:MAG: hypothetical protein QOG31_67 [Thermoplasmata archaeon]|jgi:hypothetical protein|nr:hypothetical protein [Thermoplasmata archaeon]
MRFLLPLTVLALAAVPAAQAQDACTQSSPCLWEVVVDETGFIGESGWNWTAGDWMRLSVANDDGVAHTVTLADHGVTLTIPSLEEKSQVVQLTKAGTFQLSDSPSGDAIPVTVVNGDVVDYQRGLIDQSGNPAAGAGSSSKRAVPGLELPLLAIALLAAVAMGRRAP